MKAECAARAGRRTPAAPRRPSLPSAAAQTTYRQQLSSSSSSSWRPAIIDDRKINIT